MMPIVVASQRVMSARVCTPLHKKKLASFSSSYRIRVGQQHNIYVLQLATLCKTIAYSLSTLPFFPHVNLARTHSPLFVRGLHRIDAAFRHRWNRCSQRYLSSAFQGQRQANAGKIYFENGDGTIVEHIRRLSSSQKMDLHQTCRLEAIVTNERIRFVRFHRELRAKGSAGIYPVLQRYWWS